MRLKLSAGAQPVLQGDLRQRFEVFLQPSRPAARSGTAVVAHWRGDSERQAGFMLRGSRCEIKILFTEGKPCQDNSNVFVFFDIDLHTSEAFRNRL